MNREYRFFRWQGKNNIMNITSNMENIGPAFSSKGHIPDHMRYGRIIKRHICRLYGNLFLQTSQYGSKDFFYAEKKRVGLPEN